MRIRLTCRVSSSPMCAHVAPPSDDLYTPLPHGDDWRFCGSPVPTHTRFGLAWCRVTSPIELVGWSSKRGVQDVPWFSVFQTPAVAVPMKNSWGFDSTTARSEIRPPMRAGPISRYSSPERSASRSGDCAASGKQSAPRKTVAERAERSGEPSDMGVACVVWKGTGIVHAADTRARRRSVR
jgi:hypothetical protein